MIVTVGTDAGLMRLRLCREGAEARWELEAENVRCVLPLDGGALLCGTDKGLFLREGDTEDRWSRPRQAPGAAAVTALARGPAADHGSHAIWAGTEPSAVYRSTDGGWTWTAAADLTALPSADEWSYPPRPETHHVRTILAHSEDPGRLLAGVEAGAVVSTADAGKSWLDRRSTGPRDPHVLFSGFEDPDHVLAAAGDGWHESRDFGLTWTTPDKGMDHRYVWDATRGAHGERQVVLAVAASHARAAHGGGSADPAWHLYRRQDGGAWTEIRAGLPGPRGRVPSLTPLPGPRGGFALCTQDLELFVSDRSGASWRPVDVPWPAGFRPAGVRALSAAAE